jgi:uncharacterized membrane protein YeiH
MSAVAKNCGFGQLQVSHSGITFYWHPAVDRLMNPVLISDATGLGFFSVAGTHKAF